MNLGVCLFRPYYWVFYSHFQWSK